MLTVASITPVTMSCIVNPSEAPIHIMLALASKAAHNMVEVSGIVRTTVFEPSDAKLNLITSPFVKTESILAGSLQICTASNLARATKSKNVGCSKRPMILHALSLDAIAR